MKAPDKIYIHIGSHLGLMQATAIPVGTPDENEYIRKDALLEWANAELERLWELVPDADRVSSGTTSPIGLRYLGQYMQMESVIDKLNSL